jgi:hypothetical protein
VREHLQVDTTNDRTINAPAVGLARAIGPTSLSDELLSACRAMGASLIATKGKQVRQ